MQNHCPCFYKLKTQLSVKNSNNREIHKAKCKNDPKLLLWEIPCGYCGKHAPEAWLVDCPRTSVTMQ